MFEQKHSRPNSTPAMLYPALAQYAIHWFQVIPSELVMAEARALPLEPSAIQLCAAHPDGMAVDAGALLDVVDVTARGTARASTGTARTAKRGARSNVSIV